MTVQGKHDSFCYELEINVNYDFFLKNYIKLNWELYFLLL